MCNVIKFYNKVEKKYKCQVKRTQLATELHSLFGCYSIGTQGRVPKRKKKKSPSILDKMREIIG